MPIRSKAPAERTDWTEDWSAWLGDETISSSVWEIDPPGTLTVEEFSYSTPDTRAVLSGGTVDTVYRVVNRIMTSGDKTAERTLYMLVERK